MSEHKTEHKEKKEESEKSSFSSFRENPWMFASIVLFIALVLIVFVKSGTSGGDIVSKDEAAEQLMGFVASQVSGQEATLVSTQKEGALYKVVIDLGGQEVPVYVTLDGKYLITQPIPLSTSETPTDNPVSNPVEIPKSDKPKVELFVMSYCPYGTQMQKGILPVVAALSDKIDFKVRWVYYAMHGKPEIDENVIQYCIQENERPKYNSYLQCFLEDSNSTRCLKENKIDQIKLNKCITETDKKYNIEANFADKSSWLSGQFPLFNIDKADNDLYGVAGSPTLIINGVEAQTSRSPAALMQTICQAFSNTPEVCNTNDLSTDSPSPGFGFNAGSSADYAAANCVF